MAGNSIISGMVTTTVDPGQGTYAAYITITNTGEISTTNTNPIYGALGIPGININNYGSVLTASADAIFLGDGGSVTNTGTGALVSSNDFGVDIAGAAGTVLNSGTVTGSEAIGVYLAAGGKVTNTGTSALIFGGTQAIEIRGAAGAVSNSGTITSSGSGVFLAAGGDVTNIGKSALIFGGHFGIESFGASATVLNTGTITSTNVSGSGLGLIAGGTVTNSGTAALISGEAGVFIEGAPSTVLNEGSISGIQLGVWFNGVAGMVLNSGTVTSSESSGVYFSAGGEVTNTGTSALISGYDSGVNIRGAAATVLNTGTITSTFDSGAGIFLLKGGTVSNSGAGALISGESGVFIEGAAGTVMNEGTITGVDVDGALGIQLRAGGEVTNDGTAALISGVYVMGAAGTVLNSGTITSPGFAGVYFTSGGTLFNAGSISAGAGGVAVDFGSAAATLAVDAAAQFGGMVIADALFDNLLEFAGTSASYFAGIGTQFANFNNFSFATGAAWTIAGNTTGLTAGPINGFAATDTIILNGFTETNFSYVPGAGIELTGYGPGIDVATIDITGAFTSTSFTVENVEAGTEILLCYLRGTRIATPAGEIPIEHLNIGDAVITRFGGYRRIKWIGRQSYARRFIHDNFDQIPVKLSAGCWGHNLPKRDLSVSPGHSMLVGGALVLAKSLVNGITIAQNDCPERVDYFQIEFETHDCLLAEGVWAESYADTPDLRGKFHNAAEFYALYPAHSEPLTQSLCAPRPLEGPALEAVLRPLLANLNVTPGPLHGCIDEISPAGLIRGWAWDAANPHLPVLLEISAGNQMIGTILACDYRDDLRRAGVGRGHSSFTFTAPAGALRHGPITLRRVKDHSEIPVPAIQNLLSRIKRLRRATG